MTALQDDGTQAMMQFRNGALLPLQHALTAALSQLESSEGSESRTPHAMLAVCRVLEVLSRVLELIEGG